VQYEGDEQNFVVPPQVTDPVRLAQVPFLAEQEELEQDTVPLPRQFAVHVDFSRSWGLLAAKDTASCWEPQLSEAVGGPRIAASASSVRGTRLGVWAKPTEEMKRTTHAISEAFLMESPSWKEQPRDSIFAQEKISSRAVRPTLTRSRSWAKPLTELVGLGGRSHPGTGNRCATGTYPSADAGVLARAQGSPCRSTLTPPLGRYPRLRDSMPCAPKCIAICGNLSLHWEILLI
jgi:hypothetical protein